jgi:hypothetical protein
MKCTAKRNRNYIVGYLDILTPEVGIWELGLTSEVDELNHTATKTI